MVPVITGAVPPPEAPAVRMPPVCRACAGGGVSSGAGAAPCPDCAGTGSRIAIGPPQSLVWPYSNALISAAAERAMLTKVLRWPNETGMMASQPAFRLREVRAECQKTGMLLLPALSLRRHHIKLRNPGKPERYLRLGTSAQKLAAATVFEAVVQEHLDALGVAYLTESDQREANGPWRGPGFQSPPTPDFVLAKPARIADLGGASGASDGGALCHWIEVKHFYGAGTIPSGKSACGKIPSKSKQYQEYFGPGAYVFAYGCSQTLAASLAPGCVVLDDGVLAPLMAPLFAQLRTWCAAPGGEILP